MESYKRGDKIFTKTKTSYILYENTDIKNFNKKKR